MSMEFPSDDPRLGTDPYPPADAAGAEALASHPRRTPREGDHAARVRAKRQGLVISLADSRTFLPQTLRACAMEYPLS